MSDLPTTHTLARRKKYTIHVPELGPVTYSKGEPVPPKHFTHVPGRDRRWFDAPDSTEDTTDDSQDETTEVAPSESDGA